MLKKILAFLLAAVSLFSFAGCNNSGLSVKDENKAKEVITCPNDNMFGLEKIVVFEDRIVVVLDKNICDDFKYDKNDASKHGEFTLESYLTEEDPGFRLNVTNCYSDKDTFSSSIKVTKEKYVVTVIFNSENASKYDSDEDFEIRGVYIDKFEITVYEDEVELFYIARGFDIMWYYTQVFDRSQGTWDRVDEEVIGCETQPVV